MRCSTCLVLFDRKVAPTNPCWTQPALKTERSDRKSLMMMSPNGERLHASKASLRKGLTNRNGDPFHTKRLTNRNGERFHTERG